MGGHGNPWRTVIAGVLFLTAVTIAPLALLAGLTLVQEYGAAEGYGTMLLQSAPYVVAGLSVAGLATWAAVRFSRGRAR